MRAQEAEELMDEVWHAICKKGLPINVRTGQNMDAADWIKEILKKQISIDEPIGVVQGTDYDHCPTCNAVVGQSAFYCKRCGSWLREGGA